MIIKSALSRVFALSLREDSKVEGTLQGKILAMLVEEPASGTDLMKKLNINSPGTIYPALKVLRENGLIEYAPKRVPGKKLYVLSETGILELKKIMLGIGRGYFSRHLETYSPHLLDVLSEMMIEIKPGQKVLSTMLFEPIQRWLEKTDATFLPIFEEIHGNYDVILCGTVGTLMVYGWREDEFTNYLTNLLKRLTPGGTLITVDIEKTDNIFVDMFFKEVLGFQRVPGLSKEELRTLLINYNLEVRMILSRMGILVGVSTKH
jgi:DNA-binding PadR family transcriptional regulator